MPMECRSSENVLIFPLLSAISALLVLRTENRDLRTGLHLKYLS